MALRLVVGLILLVNISAANGAIYRCTANGQTVFSDKPCPTKQERDAGRLDDKPLISIGKENGATGDSAFTPSEAAQYAPTPANQTTPIPADVPDKISKAAATVSVTRLKARDCEWAIKVDHQFSKCSDFAKFLKTGEHDAALKAAAALLEKHPALNSDIHVRQLISRMLREAQEVQDVLNLARVYIDAR